MRLSRPCLGEPKQVQYHRPEMPADPSTEAWSLLVDVPELVKRTCQEEIFGLLKKALLAHFAEEDRVTDIKAKRGTSEGPQLAHTEIPIENAT
jgi:hypothetical protein